MPNQAAPLSKRYKGWYYDGANDRLVASFNGTEVMDFDANDVAIAQNVTMAGTLVTCGAVTSGGLLTASAGIAATIGCSTGTVIVTCVGCALTLQLCTC